PGLQPFPPRRSSDLPRLSSKGGCMPLSGLPFRRMFIALSVAATAALSACGDEPAGQDMSGMKVPVSVVTVEPTPTEVYSELPGRVEAIQDAQIRARVT